MMTAILLLSILSTFLLSSVKCTGEFYTAVADMEELLGTESELINTLDGYITAVEDKLHTLRR